MTRLEEANAKIKLVRQLLKEKEYKAIAIKKQPNFSWITAGGRGFIGLASEMSCGAILVTQSDVYLVANNIEIGRLMEEELPQGFAKPLVFDWYSGKTVDDVIRESVGDFITDNEVEGWFKQQRIVLSESEQERYRIICADARDALENSCFVAESGLTEFDFSGIVANSLWAKGIEPITVLVAADDRSMSVRHYVPTAKKIENGFIVSICGRRNGLVASVTRTVALTEKYDTSRFVQILEIENTVIKCIKEGITLGACFKEIEKAYSEQNLENEWHNHHQGGLSGYIAREVIANENSSEILRAGNVLAWNPSAKGAKAESTVLLTESGAENLTPAGKNWPIITVDGESYPDVLRK